MNAEPVIIPNELIRDSAGSGKTFKLTNRFIRLLYHGQSPERIIALTFTRKAAGEFFAGILTKLAGAAADAGKASELGEYIEVKNAKPADFRAILRQLIDGMGRLSLGTIDSFFNRMLAMFPLEFGLGGGFTMMSEFEKHQAHSHALESLMARNGASKTEQESLVRSFQLATAGQDSRDFVGSFERHLDDCHELLLRAPRADQWGDASQIWPGDFPWTDTDGDLQEMVAEWRGHLDNGHGFSDEIRNSFDFNADYFAEWAPGKSILPTAKNTLLKRALEDFASLSRGEWEFVFRKKPYQTSVAFSQALARIIKHCVSRDLEAKLQRTRGIHGLLASFEAHYDEQVRQQGRLTFADLPALLAPRNGHSLLGGVGPDRLDLNYRLDGAFDHWLLDEFQDTSRAQWCVIDPLIDEVMQDPSGARTFFCIGDQKQSIFQWRGGDPRLLDRVAKRYGVGFDSRPLEDKASTYRCCKEICDLLNNVFGDAGILSEFNEPAAERWGAIWKPHVSKNEDPGQAQYLTVAAKEDRWPMVAHLLERIRPVENRLKCAILVQTNKAVREVVEHLRGALPGLPVVGDSVTKPGADNPLGAALLSLFRAAAHPADAFSAGHLRLTPFAPLLPADASEWAGAMCGLQTDVHQRGLEPVARDWIGRLPKTLDPFGQFRARQFLELARQFDETGSRDLDEFHRFIPAQEHAEAAAADVVQVMTIHKAKGLTFDVTLVPDLEGNRLEEPRKEALHAYATEEGDIDWILDLPRQDICELDPRLGQARAEARSDACYENLCKLYVALTRAKQGLYVITTEQKPRGTSRNFVRLLNATLGNGDTAAAPEMFTAGRWDWIEQKEQAAASAASEYSHETAPRRFPRLDRLQPSANKGMALPGASLFEPNGSDAAGFGRAVHAIFEGIVWSGETTAAVLEAHREKSPNAVVEVERCLSAEEVAQLFAPNPDAEVWRERAFELVLDGEFCSGVFDRVVLHDGSAQIIDFKTDRVEADTIDAAVKRHQPQLALYRRVLARLTGLAEKDITCKLVFTRPARVMEA